MKKYFTILFLSFSICIFAQTESKSFISVTDTIFTPEIDYEKSISKITAKWISPDKIFEQPKNDNKIEEPKIDSASLTSDKIILESLPKSYEKLKPNELKNILKKIDYQLKKLIIERDSLIKKSALPQTIESKNNTINGLNKEKQILNLKIKSDELFTVANGLEIEKEKLKKFLIGAVIILFVLILIIAVILQRKKINVQDIEIEKQLQDINKKNTYLEHAAKIIRHDMHSGINTYMPRGITSLEKKLKPEDIEKLKLAPSIKMIKEGLNHTQKVYKSVYEFTNLVKQKVVLEKTMTNLKELIEKNLENTSYSNQVKVDELISIEVNEILFWNALENLIKNGLKYNTSYDKQVHIYMENGNLIVKDNGTGLSTERFNKIINQFLTENENTTSLGLNICAAILKEHGFRIYCDKNNTGTKITIKIN